MAISPITPVSPQRTGQIQNTTNQKTNSLENSKTEKNSFGKILQESMTNLDNNITSTQESLENIISGKSDDFHSYIVQSEKTAVNLQMTLQVRNKIVDAYNEIMRMQV
jgi:flagellar hook-basal body complex protein FliE